MVGVTNPDQPRKPRPATILVSTSKKYFEGLVGICNPDLLNYLYITMNTLFLGCGKMGSIILNNMINEKSVKASKVKIIEKGPKDISQQLVKKKYKADLVFLAIKPQDCEKILQNFKANQLFHENTIFISILAGKKIAFLEKIFGKQTKIVRSMPNLAIEESQGIFLYQENANINAKESALLAKIFEKFGLAYNISDEKLFDPLTALFGSGPAYLFMLQEVFANITQKFKIPKDDCDQLVKQLFVGSSLMSCNSDENFKTLRNNVTSKGGVTKAGIDVLAENNSLKNLFIKVINNANKRSKELS